MKETRKADDRCLERVLRSRRARGGDVPGVFGVQQGDHCGWMWVGKGEGGRSCCPPIPAFPSDPSSLPLLSHGAWSNFLKLSSMANLIVSP